MKLLWFALVVFFLSIHALRRYDNDVVFRLKISESSQIDLLESLRSSPEYFDFWTSPSLSRPIDLHVDKNKVSEIRELFDHHGIKYQVMIENLQDLIDSERESLKIRQTSFGDSSYLEHYHSYTENIEWLSNFSKTYSNMTKLIVLGDSYEGRKLVALKIFSPKKDKGTLRRSIWVDGAVHAREWISVATNNYILSHFVTGYPADTDVKKILDQADLYFLPIANPDGYAYTWEVDRFWRKNRSPNAGSQCLGTDLNRNWPVGWGTTGSSGDSCSYVYRGHSPFSENETQIISNFLSNNLTTTPLAAYLSAHSYSQLWLYPWGAYSEPPADADLMKKAAKRSVNALTELYGTKYYYGSINTLLYPTSGCSMDWVYQALNVTFSVGLELRDTGTYGFLLPEEQILPTATETFAAFKAFSIYALKNVAK